MVFSPESLRCAESRSRKTRGSARVVASRLIRPNSTRFALHLGLVAKPTRFPEIEKLPVARCTVDYMLPLGILFQVFKSGRSYCEVPQDIRSGATVPFWIGVRGLHRRLVFALQTIPFLFG